MDSNTVNLIQSQNRGRLRRPLNRYIRRSPFWPWSTGGFSPALSGLEVLRLCCFPSPSSQSCNAVQGPGGSVVIPGSALRGPGPFGPGKILVFRSKVKTERTKFK